MSRHRGKGAARGRAPGMGDTAIANLEEQLHGDWKHKHLATPASESASSYSHPQAEPTEGDA